MHWNFNVKQYYPGIVHWNFNHSQYYAHIVYWNFNLNQCTLKFQPSSINVILVAIAHWNFNLNQHMLLQGLRAPSAQFWKRRETCWWWEILQSSWWRLKKMKEIHRQNQMIMLCSIVIIMYTHQIPAIIFFALLFSKEYQTTLQYKFWNSEFHDEIGSALK